MKTLAAALLCSVAFAVNAQAETFNLSLDMEKLSGKARKGAFVGVYLTDENGTFQRSLYLAWKDSPKDKKYRRKLRGWTRGVNSIGGQIDGLTGASLGSKERLNFTTEISPAEAAAGYQIHVDTAAEDVGSAVSDAMITLNDAQGFSQTVGGKRFISAFTVAR